MSAVYENLQAVTPPDIAAAVSAFLSGLGRPVLDEEAIFQTWKNVSASPDVTDFAVVTLVAQTRQGNNKSSYDTGSEIMTVRQLTHVSVQIDFCSANDMTSLSRCNTVSILSRDEIGISFFEPYGIHCLYADDPKRSEADDKIAFIRYTTTLHLSYWAGVTVDIASFDTITPTIENVDVHHPLNITE